MEEMSVKSMLDEWRANLKAVDDSEKESYKPCVAIRKTDGFMVIENPHMILGITEPNGDLIQLKIKIDFFKDEMIEDNKVYEQIR